MIIYRIPKEEILDLLQRQLSNFYGVSPYESKLLHRHFDAVMEKIDYNFSHNPNKYYSKMQDGVKHTYFDPFHSCQWTIFLYTMARHNYLWSREQSAEEQDRARMLSDKIYLLSKIISGADLYYEVELPSIFMCEHPTGTVIGRATYGDYFTFSQGSTVGQNHGIYPVIKDHVTLLSDAKIVGNCTIGSYSLISANTYIKDQDIPEKSLVFGSSPNLIIKRRKDI